MKKLIFLIGVFAILTACNGNKAAKEPAQQDDMEMQNDATEGVDETTPADTTMQETPADTTMTAPVQ